MVIMAQMKAKSSIGGLTSGNRKQPHERERNTFVYQHEGVKVIFHHNIGNLQTTLQVCKTTFLNLNACGKRQFEYIMTHLRLNGLVTR